MEATQQAGDEAEKEKRQTPESGRHTGQQSRQQDSRKVHEEEIHTQSPDFYRIRLKVCAKTVECTKTVFLRRVFSVLFY